MKTMYRTKKAAAFLGRSAATLASWRMKKVGPPWLRRGGWACVYDLDDLIAFRDENPAGER
jgi:hypothetical protein